MIRTSKNKTHPKMPAPLLMPAREILWTYIKIIRRLLALTVRLGRTK